MVRAPPGGVGTAAALLPLALAASLDPLYCGSFFLAGKHSLDSTPHLGVRLPTLLLYLTPTMAWRGTSGSRRPLRR